MKRKKIINITLYAVAFLTFLLMLISLLHPFLTPAKASNISSNETIGVINKDTNITQRVKSPFNDLDYIEIQYTNFEKEIIQGKLIVEIYNPNSEKIYYDELDLAKIDDNAPLRFEFDIQKDVKEKEFTLILTIKNLGKNNAFSFYETNNGIPVTSDDLELTNTISMVFNGENSSYYYSLVLLLLLCIEVFVISVRKFKNIEHKDYNKLITIGYLVSLLFISLLFVYTFIDIKVDLLIHRSVPLLTLPVFIFCSCILLINIAYHVSAKNIKLEKLFLALAIPISCLYLICIVPGEVPDENYHYREAYKVSIGDFLLKTNQSPLAGGKRFTNYGEVRDNLFKIEEETTEMKEHSSLIYSPLLYLASGFGMFIGRVLNLTILGTEYVGCFFNTLLFLISGYYIIKLLPFGKYFGIVYLLSPMYLQQATSLSGDAVINAACLLFIAYILNLRHSGKTLEIKDIIILSILILFVLISKNAYFSLLLLLLLIKNNVKTMDKKKKIILACCLLVAFSLYLGTYNYVLKDKQAEIVTKEVMEVPQNKILKSDYLFSSPTKFGYLILSTLNLNLDFYILSFAGQYLGWLDLSLKTNIIIFYLILLFVSIFFDSEKSKLKEKDKIIMFISLIINLAAVMAGLYFSWGDSRGFFIEGVQGRYFIPFLILLFLIISNKKIKWNIENKRLILASTLLYVHIYAILIVMQRYGI